MTMKKNKDFDEFIRRLEEAIENMMDGSDISNRPIFIDISINVCPSMGFIPANPDIQIERKAPVDILETEKNIYAVIGLPGMEKEDIKLSCTGWTLEVTASNAVDTLREEIELPSRVNKKGMRTKYENGILEVVFNKSRKGASKTNTNTNGNT